ncbi:1,2-phenylacetyl-CoA epoxidase, subunit C [compost metagenome]
MLAGIDEVWRFTNDLLSSDEIQQRLAAAGIAADATAVAQAWQATVEQVFERASLPVPQPASYFYLDGKRGLHTEHLGILLAEMQFLQRAYPDATW